ncbi:response regulator [Nocardioides sp. MAH-18]|uniref:Circadian input-output histidine kinase CikA n=1 Tax=Nocardioides agri TaxID=2682843 RepID=A0A6L6XKG2_9ACTN|nr:MULTISPECIES: response regulator [unclassified Nocardioides]MBA2956431.1 response regulator [Nocardioides sp. CGMCC 1.13656]MVQ47580.1 response regulator [Nocardioides sp. MAH-18]
MELSALYRDVVERSPDAIWVCDIEGRTIYANPAMCALYGVSADEMQHVTVWDSLDEQGKRDFVRHIDDLRIHGGNGEDVDVLFWRHDGTSLWVLISEIEIRDDSGAVVGFTHRISDYSGRRRALDALRESRAQLAEAHRIARLGSWWWDVDADEINASDELRALYGLDASSFPATYEQFLEIVHPSDRDQVDAAVHAARKSPQEFVFVARIQAGDDWVWTRGRGVSTADEDGRVFAMSGTHQDITETKLADLALEDQVRQNALMQAVAVAANEARTLTDVLGRARDLVLLHDDWERARAFVPDGTGERLVPFYVDDADRAADAETQDESAMELELANRVYETRTLLWSDSQLTVAFPVRYADEVRAVVTITSAPPLYRFDMIESMAEQVAVELGRVAERERVERELADARDAAMEASRQKSEFLATMSHEIRTPINGVIGLNDLLLRTTLAPEQLRLASGVQVASRALLGIINDVLDFSKIEAGMLELEKLDFEVRAVFDQVASMLGEAARAKGLELIVACHPDVPEVLNGDPTRLAQVLTNLGSNAVKFTESGEVFVRATAVPRADGGAQLQVTVTDTGVGVADVEVDHLFEAFTQADASTTRRYGGTGLGLAISREIVEALGGEIGLRANPGGGSVFWFTAELDAPTGPGVDPDDEYGRSWLSGRHVLVVDDNANNRLILSEQLARWRIRASTTGDADTAEAAVSAARTGGDPFEAVVLDLSMPGRDGLDLARSLHADPANADLRLIMLTSSGTPPAARLREAGVGVCLAKPTLAGELRHALLAELAQRGPRPDSQPEPATEATIARRILVVEDNPVNQLVASGLLEALGYHADVADDGQAALEVLAGGGYDLVLMDVQMPRMDGYAATRAIRAGEDGTGTRLPIVAMTAAAVEGERERCMAAGMDDFLTKPVDPRALAAVLEQWVGAGQAVAERRTLPLVTEDSSPLDGLALERLDELRDLDPGNTAYLDRAIGNFVANTPATLASIREAMADGDAHALKQVSHKLAGGALNLGVMAAGRTAQEIELVADTGSTDGAATLVDELERHLAEGRAALQAYQATYSTGGV